MALMRLRCTDCGTESYSAVAEVLIQEGIRCERCEGELELVQRRESLPGGKQSRFSRSLLRDDARDSDPKTYG